MRRLVVAVVLASALLPRAAATQAPVPVFGDGPTPDQPFESWWLFLTGNLDWLVVKKT